MKYISKFLGIRIGIQSGSDEPLLKAEYENYSILISTSDLRVIEGRLPKKVIEIVIQWIFENREEVSDNVNRVKLNEPVKKITPFI